MGTTEPQVSNIETGGPATVLSLVRYAAALGLAVELRLVRPRNNKKGSRK